MIDGVLLRGARGLHPEAGHLLLRPGDPTAPCGCGVYGCAEAFLSGMNFGKRASIALKQSGLTGKDVTDLANRGDPKALAMFSEYSELLAAYFLDMIVLFYPEKIILTGSFAYAEAHFLPQAKERLMVLLERRLKTAPLFPKIRVSRLGNNAGVLGAAYVALHKNYAGTC
jgi:glucokinase